MNRIQRRHIEHEKIMNLFAEFLFVFIPGKSWKDCIPDLEQSHGNTGVIWANVAGEPTKIM